MAFASKNKSFHSVLSTLCLQKMQRRNWVAVRMCRLLKSLLWKEFASSVHAWSCNQEWVLLCTAVVRMRCVKMRMATRRCLFKEAMAMVRLRPPNMVHCKGVVVLPLILIIL